MSGVIIGPKGRAMDRESLHALASGAPIRDLLNLILAAAVAGFFGACGAVAFRFTRKQRLGIYAFSLLVIGTLSGVMTGLLLSSLGGIWVFQVESLGDVIAVSMTAGFISSISVLVFSLVAQVTLRYSNFEIEIKLKQKPEPESTDGQ